MKKLILAVVVLCTAACSQDVTFNRTDPYFKPYISEFSELMQKYSPGETSLPFGIAYANLNEEKEIGSCTTSATSRMIYIDKETFESLCPDQQRALIFHEMGHCALARVHNDKLISYMNPVLNTCTFYGLNAEELDKELFTFP